MVRDPGLSVQMSGQLSFISQIGVSGLAAGKSWRAVHLPDECRNTSLLYYFAVPPRRHVL